MSVLRETSLWTGGVSVLCCFFSVSCHLRGKIPEGYFQDRGGSLRIGLLTSLVAVLLTSLVAVLLQLVGGILHAIWNYSPSWLNSLLPLGWGAEPLPLGSAELFGFLVVAPVMIVTAFAFGVFYYYFVSMTVWMIILRVRQRR